ncbi:MAG: hypothetical protein DMF63_00240 [Acidobacteria bacterium]|nr:MAG: hypothetical protein DMF63_00240 [Acidobacteriota bacterium]
MSSAGLLIIAFVSCCAIAAAVIGAFPLELSIVTIFLFAGIHNLMEFRYFAARMPVRWGRSRTYYSVAIGGVVILTATYLTLYFSRDNWLWNGENAAYVSLGWNSAFIAWAGLLLYLRGKQKRGDWSWAIPLMLFVAAAAWAVPIYWSLALVYLHPLVAMWFLERQIRRTKPEWLRAYHICLAMIPVFLIALWIALWDGSNIPEETRLFWRIAQHAGSEVLPGVSSYLLVATHVFLESIHYFVWILLIPLVDRRAIPWRLSEIPMLANANGIPKIFIAVCLVGVFAMIALWFGFALDYTTTRDIYFAFAIGHVLAEFPFLIKML